MVEQVANGHRPAIRPCRKRSKVPACRRVEIEAAFSNEHVDQRFRHQLGDRPDAEASCRRGRRAQLPAGEPVRPLQKDSIATGHDNDAAQESNVGFCCGEGVNPTQEGGVDVAWREDACPGLGSRNGNH
jgi:hypothetical protein